MPGRGQKKKASVGTDIAVCAWALYKIGRSLKAGGSPLLAHGHIQQVIERLEGAQDNLVPSSPEWRAGNAR